MKATNITAVNARILFQFAGRGIKWGAKLGSALGGIVGWGFTGFTFMPYGFLYLGVGFSAGLIIGIVIGLLNGLSLGLFSLTILSSIETYDWYRLVVTIFSFFFTITSSFAGFYLLLDPTIHGGFLSAPAAVIAAIASIYASNQIAHWYWNLRNSQDWVAY